MPYIQEPKKIPWYLRIGNMVAEKKTGKRMDAARLLAWYPKTALGAGLLESLVAHDDREVPRRLLKLIRMQTSISASCAFCIDMNSFEYEKENITPEEIEAMQEKRELSSVKSLSEAEISALVYTREVTATPIALHESTIVNMKKHFSDRAFVIIAGTVAQVNFWTRLIQGMGVTPAGFLDKCEIFHLDDYKTLHEG